MSTDMSFEDRQSALCKSLVLAISELEDVQADSTNPFHKNSYASLSAHLKQIKPVFAKHGLAIVQCPIGSSDTVGVRTIVIHTDGGSLESDCLIRQDEKMDGQKAGSIISYIRRYSLASVAGIATADDDAQSAVPAPSSGYGKFIPNPSAAPAYSAPASSGEPNFDLPVPFGKNKGTTLNNLPMGDLQYWANTWEPKPWEKTGKVNPKDLLLKKSAQALLALKSSSEPEDGPF
jgi:hypothetical protein